jgi:hypothetical protein
MLQKNIYFGVFILMISVVRGHFLEQSRNISVKKPTFRCFDVAYMCTFMNVILTEEEPEWDPVAESERPWISVQFKNSSISVFTNDVCRVFPKILYLHLAFTNIKEIRGDAFDGCSKLEGIGINSNFITKLDINTFRSLQGLNYLELSGNNLTSFPMELIKNNPNLVNLILNSNELSDIEENKLLKYAPQLYDFGFDDNEISCVRVAEIDKNLKARGVTFHTYLIVKQRYYQKMKVNGHICLSDVDYAATLYRKNTDAKSGIMRIDKEDAFKEEVRNKLATILEWIETQKQSKSMEKNNFNNFAS